MLSKPAIIPEVEKVVELKKTGVNLSGLCPFHMEDTPSFFIFNERFKCFGCGESGDVIDFVKKYYNLDFLQALRQLQIETDSVSLPKIKKKQELLNDFRTWEAGYFQELCMLIRVCSKILKEWSWDDLEHVGFIYHLLPIYRFHADILQYGDDKDKYELYKETDKTFDYKLVWSHHE
jgi:hypothetical protein